MGAHNNFFLLIGGDIFAGHKVVTLAYVKVMSHRSSKSFTTTNLIDHKESAFHIIIIISMFFRFRNLGLGLGLIE